MVKAIGTDNYLVALTGKSVQAPNYSADTNNVNKTFFRNFLTYD